MCLPSSSTLRKNHYVLFFLGKKKAPFIRLWIKDAFVLFFFAQPVSSLARVTKLYNAVGAVVKNVFKDVFKDSYFPSKRK